MKNQKGINVIAIVIGVVIGLVIVGIGGFLMLSDNNKPQEPQEEQQEPVIENTEVTAEEKQEIKEEYLGYFASVALAAEDQMVDEASIMAGVAVTRMWAEMDEEYSEETFNQDALNNLLNNNTNNIENSLTNSINNSVTSGANLNTLTGIQNDTTVDTSLLPKFPDGTTVISREADIQNAIFETFGRKLENLSQILEASWSTGSDEDYNTMVLSLSDITKANGIYTAIYTVCSPAESDFINGINIYGLPSYTIEATFQMNNNPVYSKYQLITIDVTETTTPIAYHMSYVNEKYGVIDNNGIVILEAKYSKVIIPNSYIGLFVCYTEGVEEPIILNERGIQQFKDYQTATVITSTGGGESFWVEHNAVVVGQDGYYGLVDYDGNIIYDVEYTKIEPLGYQREKIILTKQDGTKALADIHGNIISKFAYTEIGILGGQFDATVYVPQTPKENTEYTLGKTATGIYELIEEVDVSSEPIVMSTYAKEYQMQLGTVWQLALLDGIIPVYTEITVTP